MERKQGMLLGRCGKITPPPKSLYSACRSAFTCRYFTAVVATCGLSGWSAGGPRDGVCIDRPQAGSSGPCRFPQLPLALNSEPRPLGVAGSRACGRSMWILSCGLPADCPDRLQVAHHSRVNLTSNSLCILTNT